MSLDIFDQSRTNQIQKGSSTKENILVLFGKPAGTEFAENGDESWDYTYTLITSDPLARTRKTYGSHLSVTFDNKGLVKAYNVYNSNP
jgi:outer membrane protein assembly factor BamE (lipoprotein component of BamABCDE complex)